MLKKATWVFIAFACSGGPAYAAAFTCNFFRAGEPQNECQLDTAGESFCEYTFATETPNVLGFCYAMAGEQGSGAARQAEKTLLGCGFSTVEARSRAKAYPRQRIQPASRRPKARAVEEGFYAVGDTLGVPDDVFVGFLRGTTDLIAYCMRK